MRIKTKPDTHSWLLRVSGKEKWNNVFLTATQAFLVISNILFAWLLQDCVDYAVVGNRNAFAEKDVAMMVLMLQTLSMPCCFTTNL